MASNKLRLCTWNVRGVHSPIKRRKILTSLKKEHIDIALLQETHLDDAEHPSDFITKVFLDFSEIHSYISIVGGDFNCILNPLIDRFQIWDLLMYGGQFILWIKNFFFFLPLIGVMLGLTTSFYLGSPYIQFCLV